MMSTPAPQILLISGSIRDPSYTHTLSAAVEQSLRQLAVATIHWDLRRVPLPIADPMFHSDPAQHPDPRVQTLVRLATGSDGFVLASPIYHNSYSGVLKNVLDHLTIAQFRLKPIGLLSHGSNRSTQAVDHLRIVVRGLLGVAIPSQVCTAVDDFKDNGGSGYEIVHAEILARVERFSRELLAFAEQLRPLRASS